MSKSLRRFHRELARALHVWQEIDWPTPGRTPEKDYVLAVFSKISYLEIPDYELDGYSRIKLIPCLTHMELLAERRQLDVRDFLRQVELPEVFVISTERAIAVVIVQRDAVIVSLRGTRPLYFSDWAIDFRATRMRVYDAAAGRMLRFHTGFLHTVLEFAEELTTKLHASLGRFPTTPPVYVTGHSLGGALVAVLLALDGVRFSTGSVIRSEHFYAPGVHSGYSFGMPRYGDRTAVKRLGAPYHALTANDLIPYLPPLRFGFSNPRMECVIVDGGLRCGQPRGPQNLSRWIARSNRIRGLRHHLVERYIRKLAKIVNKGSFGGTW